MLRSAIETIEKKLPQLLKKSESLRESAPPAARPGAVRIHETGSFRVLEAMPDGPKGEKIFKVILISEGPGNRRNKNYYGPEAVESSVKAFEGQWCYLNHQDMAEAETLPERDVRDKAGYYKNLGVIQVKEGTACAGELHCDLSESGATLAAKVLSALKYKESFPDNGKEYVGFSVNADGDAEPRDMTSKGGGPDDNYVTAITEGDSCDLVTTPARGGRGLAVIKEGQSGAVTQTSQEEGMKKLQTVFAKFMESLKGVNDAKVKEAAAELATALKEAGSDDIFAKKDGEKSDAHLARLKGHAEKLSKHLSAYQSEDEAGDPDSDPDSDPDKADAEEAGKGGSSAPRSGKDLRRQSFRQLDGDAQKAAFAHMDADESKRDAIAGLIKESGMTPEFYAKEDLARLNGLPYLEAKREITKDAKIVKTARESVSGSVASLHRGVSESGSDNTAAFVEAARKED